MYYTSRSILHNHPEPRAQPPDFSFSSDSSQHLDYERAGVDHLFASTLDTESPCLPSARVHLVRLPSSAYWASSLEDMLALDNGMSVLLDMSPLSGENIWTGQLMIDGKPYMYSASSIALHSIPAARFVTVQEVFELLRFLRRDKSASMNRAPVELEVLIELDMHIKKNTE